MTDHSTNPAQPDGFINADAVTAMEHIHSAAMSKDAGMACEGRLAKRLTNMAMAWLDDEQQRGTDLHLLLVASKAGALSLYATVLLNTIPPGARATVARMMRESFLAQYDRIVAELERVEAPAHAAADKAMETPAAEGSTPCS